MAKSSEIRGAWKERLLGKLVAGMMRAIGLFVKFEVRDPHGCRKRILEGEQMIWALWHSGLFSAPLVRKRLIGSTPASALASASKDGAIVASVIASFGIKVIRGSSSRRAVTALIAMKKALHRGEQVMVTPDGPRGPACKLQPGVIMLAQKSGAPILPVIFSHTSSWRLNSWDRFHIPKPFSTVTVELGDPIPVPGNLDKEDFEQLRETLEQTLF